MPKTVTMYQCNVCEQAYVDCGQALDCEGRHLSKAYDAIHAGECPSCGGLTLLERDINGKKLRYVCERVWCDFSKSCA